MADQNRAHTGELWFSCSLHSQHLVQEKVWASGLNLSSGLMFLLLLVGEVYWEVFEEIQAKRVLDKKKFCGLAGLEKSFVRLSGTSRFS